MVLSFLLSSWCIRKARNWRGRNARWEAHGRSRREKCFRAHIMCGKFNWNGFLPPLRVFALATSSVTQQTFSARNPMQNFHIPLSIRSLAHSLVESHLAASRLIYDEAIIRANTLLQLRLRLSFSLSLCPRLLLIKRNLIFIVSSFSFRLRRTL